MKKTDAKLLTLKNLQSEFMKEAKGGVPLDFEDEEDKKEFFEL
jgi:hypothetical protein